MNPNSIQCGCLMLCAVLLGCAAAETEGGTAGGATGTVPIGNTGTQSGVPVGGSTGATPGTPAAGGGAIQGLPGSDSSCAGVSARAEAELRPSDVVWAIDTSGSMNSSFDDINNALGAFSDRVINAGIDVRMILLAGSQLCVPGPLGSGSCGGGLGGGFGGGFGGAPQLGGAGTAPDSNEPLFRHVDVGFAQDQGMQVVLDSYDSYKDLLRSNAQLQIVLTEDGTSPVSADLVAGHIEGRQSAAANCIGNPAYNTCPQSANAWDPAIDPDRYTFHGVVCTGGASSSPGGMMGSGDPLTDLLNGFGNAAGGLCPTASSGPGSATWQLIEDTGGVVADLAGANGGDPFGPLLDKLAEQVIIGAKVGCDYEIPPPPAGETLDPNAVNVIYSNPTNATVTFPRVPDSGACGNNMAWTYDNPSNPTRVELCPAACSVVEVDPDAQVDVLFGCETVVLI